jgi:Purple acid Phosphatase, N-terminal domain
VHTFSRARALSLTLVLVLAHSRVLSLPLPPLPVYVSLYTEQCDKLAKKIADSLPKLENTLERYTAHGLCTILDKCEVKCCETPHTPEQVHLSVTGEPTEMAVTWVTQQPAAQPAVWYADRCEHTHTLVYATRALPFVLSDNPTTPMYPRTLPLPVYSHRSIWICLDLSINSLPSIFLNLVYVYIYIYLRLYLTLSLSPPCPCLSRVCPHPPRTLGCRRTAETASLHRCSVPAAPTPRVDGQVSSTPQSCPV